jgi:putative tricarboxylic transport membrane protein
MPTITGYQGETAMFDDDYDEYDDFVKLDGQDTQLDMLDRRRFLMGSIAALGTGIMAGMPLSQAFAASFPSRAMSIFVPTREGGGADRNLRLVTGVWKKYLNTKFDRRFYPGASGRVGYETYMGKAGNSGHELIFGNMGPEVLNWVVKKPTFPISNYFYFGRVDEDAAVVFVGKRSKYKTIDDIIAAGKSRILNVGTSRIAHPATIGAMALASHTGAQFNPIPLSGGKNTRAGVATGEMDFGVLPSGGIARKGKNFRTLLVFDSKNRLGSRLNNAPTANDHFGMKLPPMYSARAFGIKTEVQKKHPERVALLQSTLDKVFADPDFRKAVKKAKLPWELISPGNAAQCAKYVKDITEIGTKYRDLMRGASAKAKKNKKKK